MNKTWLLSHTPYHLIQSLNLPFTRMLFPFGSLKIEIKCGYGAKEKRHMQSTTSRLERSKRTTINWIKLEVWSKFILNLKRLTGGRTNTNWTVTSITLIKHLDAMRLVAAFARTHMYPLSFWCFSVYMRPTDVTSKLDGCNAQSILECRDSECSSTFQIEMLKRCNVRFIRLCGSNRKRQPT